MKSKTRKLLGVLFIVLPPAILILVLVGWSIFSFVVGQMITPGRGSSGSGLAMAASIINLVLGMLGLVSVVMIPVGIIVGIILLVKKDSVIETVTVSDEKSVTGNVNQDNQ
ncbi:hypothetical protein KKG46_03165 [Patescibacteria group bacterium]|nr:hypothetical protein [Patescibacteria group bacterium]